MDEKEKNIQSGENAQQGSEETRESVLQHLIHEITDEVKQVFDVDSFVHTGGAIVGGIMGVTPDEAVTPDETDEDNKKADEEQEG